METIIISLGGSLVVPDNIDVRFLKEFRKIIIKHLKKKKFFLIVGGGKICRNYQNALRELTNLPEKDIDWMGIYATKFNAELVKYVFSKYTHPDVITNPTLRIKIKKPIAVACGWKPGCSTDFDAALIAENFKAKVILNLTDVDYVYDKDPNKYKNAKPIKQISWKALKKIIGTKWVPGKNVVFDPIAAKKCEKLGVKVVILNGRKLKNLDNFLKGKKFKGTVVC